MHHALYQKQVLRLIFEQLSRGDLARLGRTCKALFDLATNHLWSTLTSLTPFVCCLPPHYSHQQLELGDIERLDFYMRKVTSIVLETDRPDLVVLPLPFQATPEKYNHTTKKDTGISWQEIWTRIFQLRPNADFLPNLRRLRLVNTIDELLLPLVGIRGTNLNHIHVQFILERQLESVHQRFFNQLQPTSQLEYLSITNGVVDVLPRKLLVNSYLKHLRLDGWTHVGDLEKGALVDYSLPHELLGHSSLEFLQVGIYLRPRNPEEKKQTHGYLPALKTLRIILKPGPEFYQKPCNSEAFLQGLEGSSLDQVDITFPFDMPEALLLDTMVTLKSRPWLQNLTALRLSTSSWELGTRFNLRRLEAVKEALRTLLPLPKLKIFEFTIGPSFLRLLDLHLLEHLANGLPALETLRIGNVSVAYKATVYNVSTERTPLENLAALCHRFSHLVSVDITAIDALAMKTNTVTEWTCPNITTLNIRKWIFGAEQGEHPISVPREYFNHNIRAYFPNSDLAAQDLHPSICNFRVEQE